MTRPDEKVTGMATEPLPMTTAPAAPADEVAKRFLDALGGLDFAALERCLTPDVWLRALLPKKIHESNTAREAVATFRTWFDRQAATVESTEHHTMAGREHITYRLRVLPPIAPDQWHVIEQTGFCRVKDGRISRLDVVCTGHFPCES